MAAATAILMLMQRPNAIPAELWDTIPIPAQAYFLAQEQRIAQLEQRIAQLESQLNRNSKNSSQPPSADGPHVKAAPPRKPSGKKRGAQPKHRKHDRIILPPDTIIDHKPSHCHHCDTPLEGDDPNPAIEQVIDLPMKLRHVVHHRRHTLNCPHCQRVVTAPAVPQAKSGFGPQWQATVAYLSGVGRLSKRSIRVLLNDLCDIPMSLGSVSKLEAKTSQALETIHAEALQAAQSEDANVDETGWKQGISKAWLWVAVTATLTVFLIRPNRNRKSFDDLVGPTPGVLTTDRFPVYSHLSGEKRQVCWAHLRRDFQAMIDRKNAGSEVSESLLIHADILLERWQKVRDRTLSVSDFHQDYRAELRAEVTSLLGQGTNCVCAKTSAVCRAVLKCEASLWTFTQVGGVEPTNNAAERAVRHAVCWRKTSYGTDSERGSRFVERMLSVVASCRSQGRGVYGFLTEAIRAQIEQTPRPSLLPVGV